MTGGNDGIGFQTAIELSKNGTKLIVLLSHDIKKAQKASQLIKAVSTNPEFELLIISCDLSDLNSVRNATQILIQKNKVFDIIILGAASIMIPKTLTKDGFEMQFGLNHLGL